MSLLKRILKKGDFFWRWHEKKTSCWKEVFLKGRLFKKITYWKKMSLSKSCLFFLRCFFEKESFKKNEVFKASIFLEEVFQKQTSLISDVFFFLKIFFFSRCLKKLKAFYTKVLVTKENFQKDAVNEDLLCFVYERNLFFFFFNDVKQNCVKKIFWNKMSFRKRCLKEFTMGGFD